VAEFTGERLIPGEVDVDLLNEHVARYTFASRLARGKRVLDAGCGAGYGSAELARTALTVVGADVAPEAIEFARAHYQSANLHFEQASCVSLPYEAASFDLVVAFEVIEHLQDWRGFLLEAARVLSPNGQLVVSTPNKLYYTESRGVQGANPFHVHEFTFDEFRQELNAVFPHVSLFLENHIEGVTFQPHEGGETVEVRVDASDPAPDDSHFFVAVCARRPQIGNPTFVYVPRAANVLRERERHIDLLLHEIAEKEDWLADAQRSLAESMAQCAKVEAELEASNHWADQLNLELADRRARIAELQDEVVRDQEAARVMAQEYEAKIADLEQDIQSKIEWALRVETNLTAEIRKQTNELVKAVDFLHHTEKELNERTEWALRLQEEAGRLAQQVELFRASRWVKLGHKVGLGPTMPTS
jgi:ubiquinone biosynthesis O-methyltransferase